MKRTISILMPIALLFVFVFSMMVTIYSTATATPPDYTCCKYEVCFETPTKWAHGVWINGYCSTHPDANPNGCEIGQPPCS